MIFKELSRYSSSKTSKIRRIFSQTDTKQLKRTLKEFYRNVHPDILVGAPERVYEANSDSLKQLNNYINSLEDNSGSKSMKLKFYSPEKTNRKNRKYYFLQLNLKPFSTSIADLELTKTRTGLNEELQSALEETLEKHEKKSTSRQFSNLEIPLAPDDYLDVNEITNTSHYHFIKKNPMSRQKFFEERDEINKAYKTFVKQQQKDEMRKMIVEQITMIDPNISNKKKYANDIVSNLQYIKNQDLLLSNLVDPRLLLIDQGLPDEIIFKYYQCLVAESLDKSPSKWEYAEKLIHVVDFFTKNHPNIMILLSERYSIDTPGFVSIKWDDSIPKIVDYIEKNMTKSLQDRYDYLDKAYELEQIKKELIGEYSLIACEYSLTSNNLENESLFLQKLKKSLKKIEKNSKDKESMYSIFKEMRIILLQDPKQEPILSRFKIILDWNFDSNKFENYIFELAKKSQTTVSHKIQNQFKKSPPKSLII